MPRGSTDMEHVWEGRRRAVLRRKLDAATAFLRENGYTVSDPAPVDERKGMATTQPGRR